MKKISRKKFLSENPDFPKTNYLTDEYTYPEVYENYKLTLNSKSAKGHASLLSIEFPQLIKLLGVKKLRFLGDTNIPWLFHNHDYLPVKSALDYLKENKISKTFNGAIEVNSVDLPIFIKHLFWLVRCNGIVNDVYFDDNEHNIMLSVCKYGNIHISTLNSDADLMLNDVLSKTKFEMIDHDCYEPFSKSGAIAHRIATFVKN